MISPRRICVFCGASNGARPAYAAGARRLGAALAVRGVELVYGGGRAGLMGAVADGALEAGGRVIGVITSLLVGRELGHNGITDLSIVETMHERKAKMAALADGFVALPGGYGSLDELFEIIAWVQLGIHAKPVALLNTDGYYESLMTFLDHAGREGFLRIGHRGTLLVDEDPEALVDRVLAAAAAAPRS